MALTSQEETQLVNLVQREGSLEIFKDEVFAALAKSRKAAALSSLAVMLTVTVQDWIGLQSWVTAHKDNVPMHLLLDDIKAAFGARDATKLGPLLVAYVAATMGHFGE